MDKVTFITDDNNREHAIIDHGNGEFTSMLKSTYDAQQATLASELVDPALLEKPKK